MWEPPAFLAHRGLAIWNRPKSSDYPMRLGEPIPIGRYKQKGRSMPKYGFFSLNPKKWRACGEQDPEIPPLHCLFFNHIFAYVSIVNHRYHYHMTFPLSQNSFFHISFSFFGFLSSFSFSFLYLALLFSSLPSFSALSVTFDSIVTGWYEDLIHKRTWSRYRLEHKQTNQICFEIWHKWAIFIHWAIPCRGKILAGHLTMTVFVTQMSHKIIRFTNSHDKRRCLITHVIFLLESFFFFFSGNLNGWLIQCVILL